MKPDGGIVQLRECFALDINAFVIVLESLGVCCGVLVLICFLGFEALK